MNGFERLKQMYVEWEKANREDPALKEVIDYLLEREDLEAKFLNEEKTVDGLYKFIHDKGHRHFLNGWCVITNEVVLSWSVMYFSLPDKFLGTTSSINKEKANKTTSHEENSKNNVVSLEKAKKKLEKKNEDAQFSLFGGDNNETRKD